MQRLIDRYLGKSNGGLAGWLMSRVDEEMVLRIHPVSISSWDYRPRMQVA